MEFMRYFIALSILGLFIYGFVFEEREVKNGKSAHNRDTQDNS